MNARNGKIARLPREIREELNRRLEANESGGALLAWLNAQPATQALLAAEFGGVAVSKQNLSEWRAGGFAEWQTRQETLRQARELAAEAEELGEAAGGRLTDHLATALAARYATVLAGWNGEPDEALRRKLRVLHGMCRDVADLRRGEHSGARLQMEKEHLERGRDKTEEEVIARFQQWARNPVVRDWILADTLSPEEKVRRIREIYGLPPEPPDPAKAATAASGETVPDAVGQAGSNQVKPGQTE